MNSPSLLLCTIALLGLPLLLPPLSAAPPTPITAAEKEAIRRDAISKTVPTSESVAGVRTSLDKDLADSATVSKAAAAFATENGLPAEPQNTELAPAKPFGLIPSAEDTKISYEGGMYFDPDEGVLVYMKNVKVKNPQFNLSADDQLKIFFGKNPPKEAKNDKATPEKENNKSGFGAGIGGDFSEPERIVATGAVLFEQIKTDTGKEPIQASGAIFTYHIKEDKVTISGGFPWVIQPPSTYLRAMQPNLVLRISPNAGSIITDGRWEMGGKLEQKK
jgi:lipopolysaccharide export system protein LptA